MRWMTFLSACILLLPAARASEKDSEADVRAWLEGRTDQARARGALGAVEIGPIALERIAPELAAALAASKTQYARSQCVLALEVAGPKAYPAVVPVLKARDPSTRRAAAALLARLARKLPAPPGSPKLLVSGLKDGDAFVREALATLLQRYGDDAKTPLLRMLGHPKALTRRAAARGLAGHGPEIVPRLLGLLAGGKKRQRLGAMRALGWHEIDDAAAFGKLQAALADKDADTRADAAFGLGGFRSRSADALPLLEKALADQDETVVQAAATAAAVFGEPGARTLIASLGRGPALEPVRIEALAGIGTVAEEQLLEALKRGPAASRPAVLRALRAYGLRHGFNPDVRTALVSALRDKDAGVRAAAVRALVAVDAPLRKGARDTIAAALKDGDAVVRAAALRTLLDLGHPPAKLAKAAAEVDAGQDSGLRATAAYVRSLTGGLPAREAVALIAAVVRDGQVDAHTRSAALEMLNRLPGGPAAVRDTVDECIADAGCATSLRVAAVASLAAGVRDRGPVFARRSADFAKQDEAVRTAVERALAWLATQQDAFGGWKAGKDRWATGVTGLTALAFLSAGRTDEPVQRALARIGAPPRANTTMEEHVWVLLALADAAGQTGDPRWRAAAQSAARFVEAGQNPGMGWRYKPKEGVNDTHITSLAMLGLRVAQHAGLDVNRSTWAGAQRWVHHVTGVKHGQTGYNYPAGHSSRLPDVIGRFPPERTQAMTAAAILTRIAAGADPDDVAVIGRGVGLCLKLKPQWNTGLGTIDMYYWHYGALALHQIGGKPWKEWWPAARAAILDNQAKDGSWPPAGVWGRQGGPVYSTAISVLTLLAPQRYPVWRDQDRPPAAARKAIKRLRKLAEKDRSPRVRAAARTAAARIEGSLP